MTEGDNPIYPEREEVEESKSVEFVNDFIFIPPIFCDQLPPMHNNEGPAIIDNYEPSIKESVQNTNPAIIENHDLGIDQEA